MLASQSVGGSQRSNLFPRVPEVVCCIAESEKAARSTPLQSREENKERANYEREREEGIGFLAVIFVRFGVGVAECVTCERGRELCAPQIFLNRFCAPLPPFSQCSGPTIFFRLCHVPLSIVPSLSTFGGRRRALLVL